MNELQRSSAKEPRHEVLTQGSQINIATREPAEVLEGLKNCLDVTECIIAGRSGGKVLG